MTQTPESFWSVDHGDPWSLAGGVGGVRLRLCWMSMGEPRVETGGEGGHAAAGALLWSSSSVAFGGYLPFRCFGAGLEWSPSLEREGRVMM